MSKSTPAVVPDTDQTNTKKAVVFGKNWTFSKRDRSIQLSDQKITVSRRQEAEPKRSTKDISLKMPTIIRFIIRPSSGRQPFKRKAEFDTNMKRTMISDDLEELFGAMEVVSPPGPLRTSVIQKSANLPQSPRGIPPPKLPLPVFNKHNVYHKHPGDISPESWGTIKKPVEL